MPSGRKRTVQRDVLISTGGEPAAASAMEWTLQNDKVLHYLLTGREMPETWIWQWIDRSLARRAGGN